MIVEVCKFCKFSHIKIQTGQMAQRFCRINPPNVFPLQMPNGIQLMGAWPPVADEDGCGKFEQAPAIPMKERA